MVHIDTIIESYVITCNLIIYHQ